MSAALAMGVGIVIGGLLVAAWVCWKLFGVFLH